MARPRKQTVDYFPHDTDASDSRTLTILEHKFGNDGYTFWFKLLELLGRTRGHYFVFNDVDSMEFLLAKTKIKDTKTALSILATLATREAINRELYEHKIIWSQNFVNGIADVYARRKEPLPPKPDWRIIEGKNTVSDNSNPINSGENAQSKLNESKLKEITNNHHNKGGTLQQARKSIDDIVRVCEQEIGAVTPAIEEELRAAVDDYPIDWVYDAIKEAARGGDDKRNLRYVAGILGNWKRKGRGVGQQFVTIAEGELEPDPAAMAVWAKAKASLEKQVTRSYYRTWLKKTQGVGYVDGVFHVGVPTDFVALYLSQNQRSLIERSLCDFTQPGVKVDFVVIEGMGEGGDAK